MSRVIDNIRNIDANERLNPILQGVSVLRDEKVQRIIDVAIPFLCLYQPTALICSVSIGAVKSFQIISNLSQTFRQSKLQGTKELALLALTVATVALSVLMPAVSTMISQSYSVIMQVDRLRQAILKKDLNEALEATANIALSAIYVASIVTAAPEVIAISILAQGIFELYQSVGEFRKGRSHFLEGMAKLIMGIFRLSQAAPLVQDIHRNYFGKKITQVDMDRIFEEIERERSNFVQENRDIVTSDVNHRGTIGDSFSDYLSNNFYSGNLSNITFNARTMDKLKFKNIRFYNCDLDGVTANKCTFTKVKFNNCSFNDFAAIESSFINSSITDSVLNNAAFWTCNFSSFQYVNCDMTKTCLNESSLDKFEIHSSTLLETNFQGVKVKSKSKLSKCDLTDTLLCDSKLKFKIEKCTEHRFTRPVVAVLWNFENPLTYASIGVAAVSDNGAIPLKADYEPRDLDVSKLNSEVNSTLKEINNLPTGSYKSRPKELVKRAPLKTEMAKIYTKANEVIRHSDGLFLPGGKDINPSYYGETKHLLTAHDSDHRRGLYEFCALKFATEAEMPVMGICRGHQVVWVYMGGTLHQNLKGHSGGARHFLTADATAPSHIQEITRKLVGDGIHGVSLHHQGCKKIGEGLYVAMRSDDGLPEFIVSNNGQIACTQFHPEIYYSYEQAGINDPLIAAGKNFFTRFIHKANEYQQLVRIT